MVSYGGSNTAEWVAINQCPVCGGNGTPFEKMLEKRVVVAMDICTNCSTRYHNPMMTEASIQEYYESGDYLDLHPVSTASELDRARRIVKLLDDSQIVPKRILDVGSSYGFFLRMAKEKYGAAILGIEPYSALSVVPEVVKDKRGVKGKFDLITCTQTLEHLHDPLKEVAWMRSRLTEDGYILIEVPLLNKLKVAHPFIFSPEAVQLLIKKNGLKIQQLKYSGSDYMVLANDSKFNDD